eukprot:TRINITY_DN28741_c0_g1_i1.p1 TRINITY_DN28741_c0_g1~~TRINITY_DN28741_c0_g1_i1.p1  ORF type:complete len:488 (+),score=142.12 TRINITY_DN28741_c0_g1_i1:51-1514(+)
MAEPQRFAVPTRRQLLHVLQTAADQYGLRKPPRCVEQRLRAVSLAECITAAATGIDFSGTYLGPRAACCVARLCSHLPLLASLRLRGVGVYAADAAQRTDAQASNTAVCGNDAIDAVAAAAETHPALTELDLSENHIGTVGAKRLLWALQRNGRLRALDLGGSNIDPTTRKSIDAQLMRNLRGQNASAPPRRYSLPVGFPTDAELRAEELQRNRSTAEEVLRTLPPVLQDAVRLEHLSTVLDPAELTPSVLMEPHAVYLVTSGNVVVTTEEPLRSHASRRRAAVNTRHCAGDLLPIPTAVGKPDQPEPVPKGWGGIDADAVQMHGVANSSAIGVTAVVPEPGVKVWRVEGPGGSVLRKHLREALPVLRAARLLQVLTWSDLVWAASQAVFRDYDPGDEIDLSSFHVIAVGGVAVEPAEPAPGWRELSGLDAGDVCSSGAVPAGCICVARTVVKVLSLPPAPAERLRSNPAVRVLAAAGLSSVASAAP